MVASSVSVRMLCHLNRCPGRLVLFSLCAGADVQRLLSVEDLLICLSFGSQHWKKDSTDNLLDGLFFYDVGLSNVASVTLISGMMTQLQSSGAAFQDNS